MQYIQYAIYNIQSTVYNMQYTIYNIQYTICSMQYTMYAVVKCIILQVKVPAKVLCSRKGFGKEILFTLSPTADLHFLVSEIEKVRCLRRGLKRVPRSELE